MPAKFCAWKGCSHVVAGDNRWCGLHASKILTALRSSRDYRPIERARPPGWRGAAEAYERLRTDRE